jgi:hypothetical protein
MEQRIDPMGNGGPPLDDASLLGTPDDPTGIENLRFLGRLDPVRWGVVQLGRDDGEPLRAYIAGWLGEIADEPAVAAGIVRLAHFIEVMLFLGPAGSVWPGIRAYMRVTLCGLGIYPPKDSEMPGIALDEWCGTLLRAAQAASGAA